MTTPVPGIPGTAPGVTGAALRSAVAGLGARGRATADNIANLQTPGFVANRVTFEAALAEAADSGSRDLTGSSVLRSLEPVRQDGNNVNLDQETLISLDTGLRYQLMLRAIDDRFQNVRAAMRAIG
ncbi:MAG: flagellar basal body rod protein FlgB [Kineosporiaceae bacterium]